MEQKRQNIWHSVSSAFLPLLLFISLSAACVPQRVTVDSVSVYLYPPAIEIPVRPVQESCDGARGEQQEPEVLVTGQAFNSMQQECI